MSVEVIDKIKPKNNADFPLVDAADIEMPDGTRLSDHDFLESSELPEAVNVALTKAKESGEFDGKDGRDGQDGYTPQKNVDYFDGKDGLNGKNGVDGKTPERGVDYWTDADKQEIVDDVLEQIEIPEGSGGSAELPVFDLAAMGMSAVMLPSGNASIATDTTSVISALNAGAVRFKIPTVMGTYTVDMHGLSDGSGAYQCVASAMLDMAIVVMVNVTSVGIQVVVEPLAAAIGFPAVTDDDNNKIMQVVNGAWAKVEVKDSYVATFVDDYISSALEGDY